LVGRYVFPAGIVAGGILVTGVSAGFGWVLIVFGAALVALATERGSERRLTRLRRGNAGGNLRFR
jgi:hypothetical protein